MERQNHQKTLTRLQSQQTQLNPHQTPHLNSQMKSMTVNRSQLTSLLNLVVVVVRRVVSQNEFENPSCLLD